MKFGRAAESKQTASGVDESPFASVGVRLVHAEGVGAERVAGGGEGSGAGAAAEGPVVADAAAIFEVGGVVELAEEGGVAVDIDEVVVEHAADGQGEEAGGADVAGVRNEHDAVAVADAVAAGSAGLADLFAGHAFGTHAFEDDAAEGGGFCGGDGEVRLAANRVNPLHEGFAFFGGKGLQDFAAADGDEEEEAPAGDVEGLQQFVDGGQAGGSFGGGKSVDLDGHFQFLSPGESFHGAVEGAWDAADGVMMFGCGAIEGEAEAFHAVFLETDEDFAGEGGGGGGGDGGADAEAAGFVDEQVEVFAGEGVAAGEDELGVGATEAGDLAEKVQALLVIEFGGVGHGDSLRTAVTTGKGTGLGHLPVNIHGGLGKIAGSRVGMGYCTHGDTGTSNFAAVVRPRGKYTGSDGT